MISNELQQELRARFNPEGSEIRVMQLRLFDMLCYLDDFCKTHGIKYWLSSGTLLGAVRHGGFIPWDDDLDVEFFKEDYKRLMSLHSEFENERFVLQNFQLDNEYISASGKMRDKKSFLKEIHNRDKFFSQRGLFIDLFVRERGSYISTRVSHVAQYCSYALTNMNSRAIRKPLKWLLYKGMHIVLFPILRSYNRFASEKNKYRHTLGNSFYKTIPTSCLDSFSFVDFEGRKFPAPGNVDAYLTNLYGDYNQLPQLDNLRHHTSTLKIW